VKFAPFVVVTAWSLAVAPVALAEQPPATPAPASAPAPPPADPAAVPAIEAPLVTEGPSKEQCIDANEAAQKLIRAGSFAEARPHVDLCQSASCPEVVRTDCADLAKAMVQTMPTIRFEARDAKGALVTNVKITMDGKVVAERIDATPLTVDPGKHSFEFESPGLPRTSKTISLNAGEQRTEQVEMVDKTGQLLRTGGLVLGGVGALLLGYGGFLGVRAKIRYDKGLDHCPTGPNSCDPVGVEYGHDAHDDAATATTMMIVGAVLGAGGAALYFFVPEEGFRVAPAVGPGAFSLEASTTW